MQSDMVEIERLREHYIGARRQRMIRSHHHGEVVVAIVKRLERPRLGLARADTDLGGAFLDAANHLPARALLQIDPQAAKACFFLDATQFKIREKT